MIVKYTLQFIFIINSYYLCENYTNINNDINNVKKNNIE